MYDELHNEYCQSNQNPVHNHSSTNPAHYHSATHAHAHTHDHHEGGKSHAEGGKSHHEGEHSHVKGENSPAKGEHSHAKGEPSSAKVENSSAKDEPSPAPFILKYMLEHNTHHAEELHALAHQLEDAGAPGAADAVKRALEYYEQGNVELATAVEQL